MILPPSAPRNLQATGRAGQIILAWQLPPGNGGSPTSSYKIYRGTSAGGETLLATIGNLTTWTDTSVAIGQTYYYKVSAVSSAGEGALSNEASTTPFNVPSTPRNLIASAGDGQVLLEWQSPASNGGAAITNYTIYRGTSPGAETMLITIGNMTTWTDMSVTNEQNYYYKITATSSAGEGLLSKEANATPSASITLPSAPSNLQPTAGNGQVMLSWQAPDANGGSTISHYKIYRGTTPGGEALIATIGNGITFTDTGLTNGQLYYYHVSAVNGEGEGSMSNEASVIPATVPTVPQSFTATPGNAQIVLNWVAPASNGGSAITGYRIYRGTTPGGETFLINPGNVTSFADSGLTNGVQYFFKVCAVNIMGNGTNATEASATPATIPGAPTLSSVVAGNGQVTLTWSAPASNGGSPITAYNLWRGTSAGAEALAVSGVTSPCTSTGLMNGEVYYFKITAVNALGEGTPSNEASATPATVPGAPTGLTATPGNTQVVLNWVVLASNGGSAITGYRIYQGTTPGSETLLAAIGNVTSYTSTGLANGHRYYFMVAGVNALGTGVNSTDINATPATVPGLPRNLVVSFGNGHVMLAWQAPGNNGGAAVTNYNVYRGTSTGEETLSATVGNVTTYVDTGLANNQVYYYEISAINAAGEGNRTSEVRVVHQRPVARFTVGSSPFYINAPITIADASVDGDSPIVAWFWLFGDDSNATTQNVTHAYAEPGTYTITLIVRDGNGLESNTTMAITVVAITSRQGLMNITAIMVIMLSAGVVTVVTLKKRPNRGNRI